MPDYRERLSPSPWAFVAMLLLLPAVTIIGLPFGFWVGIVLAVIVTALAMWLLIATTPVVEVAGGTLRAGRATIPTSALGDIRIARGEAAFLARGRELAPSAYMLLRPGIDPVLTVQVHDEADPTPYWIIATRRPEELRDAISASRTVA